MGIVVQQPFTCSEDPNMHLQNFLEVCSTFQLQHLGEDETKGQIWRRSKMKEGLPNSEKNEEIKMKGELMWPT